MGGTLNSLCSQKAYELGGVQRGVAKWEIGPWHPDQADVTPKHAQCALCLPEQKNQMTWV